MTRYTNSGKQVLHGRYHVADACDERTAERIADALNNNEPETPDAVMPELELVPVGYDRFTARHDMRQESDEIACSCGARWPASDGKDGHP